MVYAVILDCADYWRHRLSHRFGWWWALHSLHHAQRQMTFWSDDRNHVLDDLIGALWFGVIALAIGVPPLQFPLLVLVLRFLESLSHANARVSFGAVGRAVADLAALPSRASRRCSPRGSGAATTARCCRGGTCCSAPPTSAATTWRPVIRPATRRWRAVRISASNGPGCGGSPRRSPARWRGEVEIRRPAAGSAKGPDPRLLAGPTSAAMMPPR